MATPLPSNARPVGPVWALFGFDGRLSRQPYWLGFIFIFLVVSATTTPFGEVGEAEEIRLSPVAFIALIGAVWSQFALAVKRLHDRGLTGWWCLVLFAPILFMATPAFILVATVVNFGFFGALGIVPGTPGPNRFGPGPNQRAR